VPRSRGRPLTQTGCRRLARSGTRRLRGRRGPRSRPAAEHGGVRPPAAHGRRDRRGRPARRRHRLRSAARLSRMSDDFLDIFRTEATERLETIAGLLMRAEQGDSDASAVHALMREAHTLNGAAGMVGLPGVADDAHELKDAALRMRMQPLSSIAGPLRRAVRETATALGKDVDLVLTGTETELDRAILEELPDVLVHLVRNAVDHGIEAPDERIRNGKPRSGRLEVGASQRGSLVEITVSDDGRGVD